MLLPLGQKIRIRCLEENTVLMVLILIRSNCYCRPPNCTLAEKTALTMPLCSTSHLEIHPTSRRCRCCLGQIGRLKYDRQET